MVFWISVLTGFMTGILVFIDNAYPQSPGWLIPLFTAAGLPFASVFSTTMSGSNELAAFKTLGIFLAHVWVLGFSAQLITAYAVMPTLMWAVLR